MGGGSVCPGFALPYRVISRLTHTGGCRGSRGTLGTHNPFQTLRGEPRAGFAGSVFFTLLLLLLLFAIVLRFDALDVFQVQLETMFEGVT